MVNMQSAKIISISIIGTECYCMHFKLDHLSPAIKFSVNVPSEVCAYYIHTKLCVQLDLIPIKFSFAFSFHVGRGPQDVLRQTGQTRVGLHKGTIVLFVVSLEASACNQTVKSCYNVSLGH